MFKRLIRPMTLALALAIAAAAVPAFAQQAAPWLARDPQGTLYVIAGGTKFRIVPYDVSNEDLAVYPSGNDSLDGTIPVSGGSVEVSPPTEGVPSPGFTSTTVVRFQPVGDKGPEQQGTCWTGSIAVQRDGAWRCQNDENRIYDPCFVMPGLTDAVICGATPTDPYGFKLHLTEPLPAAPSQQPPGQPRAWAFELVDGADCYTMTGTLPPIQGEPAEYVCSDGWYVQGDLKQGDIWFATQVKPVEPGPGVSFPLPIAESREIAVRTVWY